MTDTRPTVLIIDDSPEDREILQLYLGDQFAVLTADSGARGLALIAEGPPDCVLLDYVLPDMTALEVLAEWDRAPVDATAVIVLTGHAEVGLAVECMKLGAHDFLSKGRFGAEGLRRAVTHGIETVGLRRQLTRDLDAMTRLHRLGTLFVQADNLAPVLTEIVDAAIAIGDADFGNIQLLDPASGDLRIVAQRGFPPEWLDFWNRVTVGHGCCGAALERRERIIVEDVEHSPIFVGTPALDIQRAAGVRAVQSTPLITRSGTPVGMFSTHWRTPHRPDERAQRLLDLLARQTADIIERMQLEESLHRSHTTLQAALEAMTDGVFISDTQGRFIHFNQAFARFHRFPDKDACARTLAEHPALVDVFFPDGTPVPLEQWAVPRALRGETVTAAEYGLRRKDTGETWTGSYNFAPIGAADGSIIGSVVTCRDVTQEKALHQALARSEERFRVAQDLSPDGFTILRPLRDADGGVSDFTWVYENPAIIRVTGYDLETIGGRSLLELFPAHRGTDIFEAYRTVAETGVPRVLETSYQGETIATRIWLRLVIVPMREEIAILAQDITERKQITERLQRSEERLRHAMEATRDGIWDWHLPSGAVDYSPGYARMLGYAPDDLRPDIGTGIDLIHPEERERIVAQAQRLLQDPGGFEFEFRVRTKTGDYRWVLSRGKVVERDGTGAPVRAVGTHVDITERKQMELMLRRYQQIVDTAGEKLLFIDRDLRIGMANPAYARTFQRTPAELVGRRIEELLTPDAYANVTAHLELVLAGQPQRFTQENPYPESSIRFQEVIQEPFSVDGEVQGFVVSLHDVTALHEAQRMLEAERRQLEERVVARTAELRASEAHMHQLAERLQLATEAGGIGVWEWEIDTGRVVWDEQLYRLYGVEPARFEPAYEDWKDSLLHPDDVAAVETSLARVFQFNEPFDQEFRIHWPDGSLHWIASLGKVIRDGHGASQRMVGVNWDLTDRKIAEAALRASEARVRAIIDSSPVPTSISEESGSIRYLNAAFVQAFGYTLADIPTMTDWQRLAFPDPDERERLVRLSRERLSQVAREGESSAPMEIGVHCKDGSVRTVMVRFTPLKDGERLNTLYDVSDLKRAQTQAEQASQVKSEFLAHMSHEIRTPMNGILGLAELALQRPVEPRVRDYLDNLQQAARTLLGILNDILDQSKLEAGQLSLDHRAFDPATLLEHLRSLFAVVAMTQGVELVITTAPAVPRALWGDPLRLEQILTNLLSNALKFTARGQVRLEVGTLEPVGTHARLRVCVADTGIGMDAATRAHVFAPFTQGDASIARRFGGTGLGLSISRRLVELMGGRLTVTSEPGVGSTFILEVRLEVAPADALPAATAPAPARLPTWTGTRVLVAEDQPLNQRVIGDMLRLLGVEVTLANHGGEALERLAAGSFDAVLMDIQMPVMDGLTATRHIREHPAWAGLPVIALTAGVTAPERERIRANGLSDLLPKPVTLDALRATLGRWLPAAATRDAPAHPPAASVAPDAVPALPGFDLSRLRQIAADGETVRSFLQQFADTVRGDVDAIAAALEAADPAAAGVLAHRLKGVAGTVGANALQDAAVRLEAALGTDATHLAEALARLRQTHGEALEQIAALPAPPAVDEAPLPTTLPAAARPLVTEIHTRLVSGLLPPRALVAELQAVLPAADQALIQTLRYLLDRVDYRAACHLLAPFVAGASTPPAET